MIEGDKRPPIEAEPESVVPMTIAVPKDLGSIFKSFPNNKEGSIDEDSRVIEELILEGLSSGLAALPTLSPEAQVELRDEVNSYIKEELGGDLSLSEEEREQAYENLQVNIPQVQADAVRQFSKTNKVASEAVLGHTLNTSPILQLA